MRAASLSEISKLAIDRAKNSVHPPLRYRVDCPQVATRHHLGAGTIPCDAVARLPADGL